MHQCRFTQTSNHFILFIIPFRFTSNLELLTLTDCYKKTWDFGGPVWASSPISWDIILNPLNQSHRPPHSMGQCKQWQCASSAASSSAGITGVGSTASSPQPSVDEPTDKKSKFEKRYKTAISLNEDVICMYWCYLITTSLTRNLEKQMKLWTSQHFNVPSIMEEDGEVTYTFICKKWVMHVWTWK